jgi:hypothetical protein
MRDTFACTTANFLTHFIISIAVLENVAPTGANFRKSASRVELKLQHCSAESNSEQFVKKLAKNSGRSLPKNQKLEYFA